MPCSCDLSKIFSVPCRCMGCMGLVPVYRFVWYTIGYGRGILSFVCCTCLQSWNLLSTIHMSGRCDFWLFFWLLFPYQKISAPCLGRNLAMFGALCSFLDFRGLFWHFTLREFAVPGGSPRSLFFIAGGGGRPPRAPQRGPSTWRGAGPGAGPADRA